MKPTPTGRIILDMLKRKMPAYADMGLNVAHVDDVAQGQLLAFERGEPGNCSENEVRRIQVGHIEILQQDRSPSVT